MGSEILSNIKTIQGKQTERIGGNTTIVLSSPVCL